MQNQDHIATDIELHAEGATVCPVTAQALTQGVEAETNTALRAEIGKEIARSGDITAATEGGEGPVLRLRNSTISSNFAWNQKAPWQRQPQGECTCHHSK